MFILEKKVLKYMPIIAPREAPAETPIKPGSAKGFLKRPCRQAPQTAKVPPTTRPSKILGILIENRTVVFASSNSAGYSSNN